MILVFSASTAVRNHPCHPQGCRNGFKNLFLKFFGKKPKILKIFRSVCIAARLKKFTKDNWKLFFLRTHFFSFSFILMVYRVLAAFSLNTTLIFTLIIIIHVVHTWTEQPKDRCLPQLIAGIVRHDNMLAYNNVNSTIQQLNLCQHWNTTASTCTVHGWISIAGSNTAASTCTVHRWISIAGSNTAASTCTVYGWISIPGNSSNQSASSAADCHCKSQNTTQINKQTQCVVTWKLVRSARSMQKTQHTV